MKKFALPISIAAAFFLAACGSDDGDFATRSGESSSSGNGAAPSSAASVQKSTLTDSRDGKTYATVEIGGRTWMAENLDFETENSYCYEGVAANCSKYGRLYTWSAAKLVCPEGWSLPTREDFEALFEEAGGKSVAGKALKSASGWEKGVGPDDFGFSALPAGTKRYDDDLYSFEGCNTYFWTSTEWGANSAYTMSLYCSSDGAELAFDKGDEGNSVRCIKD